MPDNIDENVFKREMPHSDEAERSVIGALLLTDDMWDIETVMSLLTPNDFRNERYSQIFDAMKRLFESKANIDEDTVLVKCKELGYQVEYKFIAEIITTTVTSKSIKTHAQTVRDYSTMRGLITTCNKITNDIYTGNAEADDLFDTAENDLFKYLQNRRGVERFESIQEVVGRVITEIGNNVKNENKLNGIPTGFVDLDRILNGLHGSELDIIAARPAMGKTAFALNIVANACIDKNYNAAIFSLEMGKEELVKRLLSLRSGVSAEKLRTSALSKEDLSRLVDASLRIGASGIEIEDTGGMKVSDVRAMCHRVIREKGRLDLIVIDYLQLMKGDGRFSSRENEIASISRDLKSLAKELKVPVVALAQLNRSAANRDGHRPMMSDLRDSGSIEQDADVIMFIHREDYYEPETTKKGIAEIIIAKQRNGATGTVELVWIGDKTMFANKEKARNRIQEAD